MVDPTRTGGREQSAHSFANVPELATMCQIIGSALAARRSRLAFFMNGMVARSEGTPETTILHVRVYEHIRGVVLQFQPPPNVPSHHLIQLS